ncbi:hypothetical protein OQA88_7027 [Cercophora sp. LCS_1]
MSRRRGPAYGPGAYLALQGLANYAATETASYTRESPNASLYHEAPRAAIAALQTTLSTPLAGAKLHVVGPGVERRVCTATVADAASTLKGCLVSSRLIIRPTKWPEQEKNQPLTVNAWSVERPKEPPDPASGHHLILNMSVNKIKSVSQAIATVVGKYGTVTVAYV